MTIIWEKAILILWGNLNSGLSYIITTVSYVPTPNSKSVPRGFNACSREYNSVCLCWSPCLLPLTSSTMLWSVHTATSKGKWGGIRCNFSQLDI